MSINFGCVNIAQRSDFTIHTEDLVKNGIYTNMSERLHQCNVSLKLGRGAF